MKKTVFGLTLALQLAGINTLAATDGSLQLHGLGFVAPQVTDRTKIFQPAVGEIIFDQGSSGFYGFNDASTWVPLSGGSGGTPVAPVVHTYATAGTFSYSPPTSPAPLYIRVRLVGAGGGGGGSGTGGAPAGGLTGGTTSFSDGLSITLTGNGGTGGVMGSTGGIGGSGSSGSISAFLTEGGSGNGGSNAPTGGSGGNSMLGGGGGGMNSTNPSRIGGANTGGGGGGAGIPSGFTGGGGGAGGGVDAILTAPLAATYTVIVGGHGTGGGAGTSGVAGGDGADGQLVIEEFYQ